MKKYFIFLFVLAFSTSVFAAPVSKNIAVSRLQTVNDIKKISFPYKPVPVSAQPSSGSTDTTTSTYTPSETYSTGSGLILTPAYLVDPGSVSTLSLFNTEYNYTSVSNMSSASDPFASLRIPPLKNASTLMGSVAFGKMAKETHTYVLTLKMDKLTSGGYFRISANDTEFSGNQILYNGSTKEHRILFSFAPATSQLSILIYYVNSSQTNDAKINFYYAQLIRLD
jgi:hypothetical protein